MRVDDMPIRQFYFKIGIRQRFNNDAFKLHHIIFRQNNPSCSPQIHILICVYTVRCY